MRQQPGRKVPRRPRPRTTHGLSGWMRRRAVYRTSGWMRRRAARGGLGRIRLGRAGASPRLRRWALAVVLLGLILLPYPTLDAVGGAPAAACRSGCQGGSVASMIKWTQPLPGSWQVLPGLTGTVPASGQAYVSVGYGVAAAGTGLTVFGFSDQTGAPLWDEALTGFPAGAAIISVRTWPGEVTAGVSYTAAGHPERAEVVISDSTGTVTGRYPAAMFGGAVDGNSQYTVIVGSTAVTSYDNGTGRVRWRVATGPVPLAWRTDGGLLYLAVAAGGFLGSAPVTALRQINLATGADLIVQPIDGFSFGGTFSAAFDGVVLFSTASGVTAYSGLTGAWLWSLYGAVPEGTDPRQERIYLTRGSDLVAVNPLTGQVTATASGSAAALYAVRDGVALGLDQGANGDAWGYDISAQRVTLSAAGLGWPHYFVDLSGVGGSADPGSDLVVIAACTQLAPSPVTSSSTSPTASPSSGASTPPSSTPSPDVSPSASSAPGQGCLHPELVALNL